MQAINVYIFATTTTVRKSIDYQSQCEWLKIIDALQMLNCSILLGIPELQKEIDNLKENDSVCSHCR